MSKEIKEQNTNIKVHVWNSTTFWALGKKKDPPKFVDKIKEFLKKNFKINP
mgnify:CR=1 FL=1